MTEYVLENKKTPLLVAVLSLVAVKQHDADNFRNFLPIISTKHISSLKHNKVPYGILSINFI